MNNILNFKKCLLNFAKFFFFKNTFEAKKVSRIIIKPKMIFKIVFIFCEMPFFFFKVLFGLKMILRIVAKRPLNLGGQGSGLRNIFPFLRQ